MPVDQATHFANDLERLINRYRDEYDITYAQLVGVLHIQSFMLCREAELRTDDQDDEQDGLPS